MCEHLSELSDSYFLFADTLNFSIHCMLNELQIFRHSFFPILLNRMTLYLVSSSAVMTCNVCALFGSVRLRVGVCLADNACNFLFVIVLRGSIVMYID